MKQEHAAVFLSKPQFLGRILKRWDDITDPVGLWDSRGPAGGDGRTEAAVYQDYHPGDMSVNMTDSEGPARSSQGANTLTGSQPANNIDLSTMARSVMAGDSFTTQKCVHLLPLSFYFHCFMFLLVSVKSSYCRNVPIKVKMSQTVNYTVKNTK